MCLCNLVSCFGLDLSGGKLNFPALLDIAIYHTLRHSTTLPGGLNAQLHPVLILIIYVIQLHSLTLTRMDDTGERDMQPCCGKCQLMEMPIAPAAVPFAALSNQAGGTMDFLPFAFAVPLPEPSDAVSGPGERRNG